MELAVEIMSGGSGTESKLSQMVKSIKDPKAGKAAGKDGKAAGAGAAAGAPPGGGAADDDKGKPVPAEVLPVESPPTVRKKNIHRRECTVEQPDIECVVL